jgi:UDP-galactopyranose mutase
VFDYLIVGAGFAGSVLAERLARISDKSVLLVDRGSHIGGNAYDHYDNEGILVHNYGPHIFHTNSSEVFYYLSQFTNWRPYEHHVLTSVDGQLLPMPINLDTLNALYGLNMSSVEVERLLESMAEKKSQIRTLEDAVVSRVGRELYDKFFRNYTRKQWGIDPSELNASVASRVPVRTNRDSRYFTDTFQAMPLHGYTRMFENMLDHRNIEIPLNADSRSSIGQLKLYSRQMHMLMHATLWLSISILCFIAAVFCTSISVLLPKVASRTVLTVFFSFAGMLILGASVVIEIIENHLAKEALVLETADFPKVLSDGLGQDKREFQTEYQNEKAQRA